MALYPGTAALKPRVHPGNQDNLSRTHSGCLYWYRSRHYDATRGRFGQADKWGKSVMNPVGYHAYGYVSGNPVRFVDPWGFKTYLMSRAIEPDFSTIIEKTYSPNTQPWYLPSGTLAHWYIAIENDKTKQLETFAVLADKDDYVKSSTIDPVSVERDRDSFFKKNYDPVTIGTWNDSNSLGSINEDILRAVISYSVKDLESTPTEYSLITNDCQIWAWLKIKIAQYHTAKYLAIKSITSSVRNYSVNDYIENNINFKKQSNCE
jgi:RHS repeat-associated protein